MCAHSFKFPKPRWSVMDIEEINRACEKMLKEAGEYREVANSLPSPETKPDTTPAPDHLRWRN